MSIADLLWESGWADPSSSNRIPGVVPPYPRGIYFKTPSGCLKTQILPNLHHLPLCWKRGGSFFMGRCGLSSNFYLFQSKPIPESGELSLAFLVTGSISVVLGDLLLNFSYRLCAFWRKSLLPLGLRFLFRSSTHNFFFLILIIYFIKIIYFFMVT